MPALRASEMIAAVSNAFRESGGTDSLISPLRDHPRQFVVQTPAGVMSVWVYVWTLTHGGRRSLPDEYRIQMTGVFSPLELNPTGYTILVGYEPNLKVFAGFDLKQHRTFTKGSPSVQVDIKCLKRAIPEGLSSDRKSNSELVIGIRPDHFLKYISIADKLHEFGPEPTLLDLFSEAPSLELTQQIESLPLPQNAVNNELIEGLDLTQSDDLGEYPIDSVLIRQETRTVYEIVRRINDDKFILDPDFQRDFIWNLEKQSRLIESTLLRIPLPVIYLAERDDGKTIIVDGLQRLTTFKRYLNDEFNLRDLDLGSNLNTKKFSELLPKLQNRIEDAQLILYLIDSKVRDRAKLDIFERVNGGVPLSRQQMRNCIYTGAATRLLKQEAEKEIFLMATGGTLNRTTMRDRECINRFFAFELLKETSYKRGDMDDFLAEALRRINRFSDNDLSQLSASFEQSMSNNYTVFGKHAFRKHKSEHERRSVINVALFDVLSVLFAHIPKDGIGPSVDLMKYNFYRLLDNSEFNEAISLSTNSVAKVQARFRLAREYMNIN